MKLTKAIIAVAGYGTRRLPITKSIEKCMLPIGNRPIVDYLVEDCINNGLTDIIFVVGEQHEQIKSYYSDSNERLEIYLETHGKHDDLAALQSIGAGATFRYVVQRQDHPYGTATALALCADLIDDDERVVFLAGDDFVYNPGGESGVAQLLHGVGNNPSGLLAAEIAHKDVNKYGVIEMQGDAFVRIVEKPAIEQAPTNLINISKYVFDKDVINHAVTVLQHPAANGECQITDALNMYVADGKKVSVIRADGDYLDSGSVAGWLRANTTLATLNN